MKEQKSRTKLVEGSLFRKRIRPAADDALGLKRIGADGSRGGGKTE